LDIMISQNLDDDTGVYHITKRQTVPRHVPRIMCITTHIEWEH
jgi:hypothetical protein